MSRSSDREPFGGQHGILEQRIHLIGNVAAVLRGHGEQSLETLGHIGGGESLLFGDVVAFIETLVFLAVRVDQVFLGVLDERGTFRIGIPDQSPSALLRVFEELHVRRDGLAVDQFRLETTDELIKGRAKVRILIKDQLVERTQRLDAAERSVNEDRDSVDMHLVLRLAQVLRVEHDALVQSTGVFNDLEVGHNSSYAGEEYTTHHVQCTLCSIGCTGSQFVAIVRLATMCSIAFTS